MRGFLVAGTVGLLIMMNAPAASADLLQDLEETSVIFYTGVHAVWIWEWAGHPFRQDGTIAETVVVDGYSACGSWGCKYEITVLGALGKAWCKGTSGIAGTSTGLIELVAVGPVLCDTGSLGLHPFTTLGPCGADAAVSGGLLPSLTISGRGAGHGVCAGTP